MTIKRKAEEKVEYWHILVLSLTEMAFSYMRLFQILLSIITSNFNSMLSFLSSKMED